MAEIRLQRTVRAPIEHVFDLLAEHDRYDRFRGIQASELTREGTAERNGVGARRRIRARPLVFEEEITRFERPTRLDYRILDVNVPLRHQGGSIALTSAGDAITEVSWTSTFTIEVPLAGAALGALGARLIRRGFGRVLDDVEALYAGPSTRSV
jgi:uncharacterized protein YndB with AHSA1/START domain